jgi:hypothetical protein
MPVRRAALAVALLVLAGLLAYLAHAPSPG